MKASEAKKLEKFGIPPAWGAREDSRPNEDRPVLIRPELQHSEFYKWIFHGTPINYRRWYQDKVKWRVLPAEEKHRSCSRRMALECGVFRTLLPEVYGDKGYQIMDAVYASFAKGEYERGRAAGLIKEPAKMGPKQLASYLLTNYDIEGWFPIVITEASDERVRTQLFVGDPEVCPYGTRRGDWCFCTNTGGWERELTKMVNPKLRTRVTKSKNCGDYCCELTIEYDDGSNPPATVIRERPPIVRPELEHSETYKWAIEGKPQNEALWTDPLRYRILPWETKHELCARKLAAEAGCLRTMIAELFGDEGYQLIEKAYASFAYPEYEIGMARGYIGDPDEMGPLEVASYICFLYDIAGRGVLSIVDASDEGVKIQHFHGLPETCYYLARKGDWNMCVAEAAFENALTKLMNPKLRARRTKGKIYGDYCCELTIDWDPQAK